MLVKVLQKHVAMSHAVPFSTFPSLTVTQLDIPLAVTCSFITERALWVRAPSYLTRSVLEHFQLYYRRKKKLFMPNMSEMPSPIGNTKGKIIVVGKVRWFFIVCADTSSVHGTMQGLKL